MTSGADRGFVLRTWPLREADLIVSLYSHESGKVRGVARGARRPKARWAGALDSLTEISFQWKAREGEELLSLTDGSIIRSPYHAVPELDVTWTLAFVAELVHEGAPPHDADVVLYRLCRTTVDALLAGRPARAVALYAEAWLLRLHGMLPDIAACAGCKRGIAAEGGTWHWSVHGIACAACIPWGADAGPSVLPDDLAFLAEIQRRSPLDATPPTPASARRLRVFLRHVTRDFLGKELKSERFLDELDA